VEGTALAPLACVQVAQAVLNNPEMENEILAQQKESPPEPTYLPFFPFGENKPFSN